jgi:hypothetical protein
MSYRILNPNKTFNSFNINLNSYAEFHNITGRAQEAYFNLNVNTTNKKNHYAGGGIQIEPFETYDFYQSRVQNRFVYNPKAFRSWFDISTNFNNPFAVETGAWYHIFDQDERNNMGLYFNPRYRFSDKFLLIYGFEISRQNDEKGLANNDDINNIIFVNRNRNTIVNSLNGKYSISPKMSINLKARHYWSYAQSLNFLTLTDKGYLERNSTYNKNHNFNFNTWNFDLSYSWWLAPGSQLSFLYRNNASLGEEKIDKDVINNLDRTIGNDLNNSISISFRYCIDYNNAKNWFKA